MKRAWLLMAGFLVAASAAKADTRFAAGGGAMLTPWTGYKNAWGFADFHSDALTSARWTSSFDLLARSDSPMPLLGNINEALYHASDTLSIGRAAPRAERSLVSLDRNLNQHVCQTPFECSAGGDLGAHYVSGDFRLGLELVSLPNYSVSPSLAANGSLSSSYRWSDIPYQFVEIDGNRLPLRITTAVDLDATTLFAPGLVAEKVQHWSSGLQTNFVVASERSKSPYNRRSDGVLVIDDPEQGLLAVANSDQHLSFPWQHVLLAQSLRQISDSTDLHLDLGARFSVENSFEASLDVDHHGRAWRFKAQAAWHRQGDYDFVSLIPELGTRFGAWDASLAAQGIVALRAQSLILQPRFAYAFDRHTSIFAKGLLISAAADEKMFAALRADDFWMLGAQYVF